MKLASIATQQQMFTLLATDHGVAVADTLHLQMPGSTQTQQLAKVLQQIIETYRSGVSGVVIAPELTFDVVAQIFDQTGCIYPLERRNYDADPLSVPILAQNWGVEAIKNNYGMAKLELFFNPEEPEAASKKQLVAEVYDYCQHEGIELLLEVLVFMEGTEQEYQERFPELQLGAIQELRSLCHLMALEYPLNALGAVTVTAELDVPWILTMRDTSYEVAKEQLRTALESGARGFLALEQFLPDKATQPAEFDQEKFETYLQTTGRDRVLELARIVAEAS